MRKLSVLKLLVCVFAVLLSLQSCSEKEDVASAEESSVVNRSESLSLYGKWHLVGYGNESDFHNMEGKYINNMYFSFNEDGTMEGKVGNELHGLFSIKDDGSFKFEELGGTKALPDDEDMVFVENNLRNVTAFKIVDNSLRLLYSQDGYIELRK